jgi:hypothetical protein
MLEAGPAPPYRRAMTVTPATHTSGKPLDKPTIIRVLAAALEPMPEVRAATLGGSDANARADELSDVDLFLIVAPGHTETAAAAVERALGSLSPIAIRYRLPMPTWHGFHQAFYQLRDAPEHLMVDWVIVETGTPHPWFEVERHGTHRVLFDKDGLVRPAHADLPALRAAAARRVADLRARFPLYRHLPPKLARRGLPADAIYFYHGLVLRPLVDLARCVHRPERHDFGFRYLKDDLPADLYAAICRLSYPRSVDDLPAMTAEASGLIEGLLAAWDACPGPAR